MTGMAVWWRKRYDQIGKSTERQLPMKTGLGREDVNVKQKLVSLSY